MTPLEDAIAAAIPTLKKCRSAVLTTHVNPDGDGLGSELALAEWLESRGCVTHILNHSNTPVVYRFLDPTQRIRVFNPAQDSALILQADLILVIDTSHLDRVRSLKEFVLASHAATICIDHHLEAQGFADFDLIDEEATSTGEIVYRVLQQLQGPHLTRSMATNLYCAIMTDTGSFRFPRVDAEIHRIAASLLEYGADPVSVYSNVYERWSNGRIHLLGEMLAGLKSGFNGQLAYVTITREMLERTGTTEEDADNFTVYPMSIEGVKMGILFLELPEGVKISVRSKGDVPANLLAKQFNGNGHKNAAGARVYTAGLAEVQQQVVAAAGNFLSPSTIRQL